MSSRRASSLLRVEALTHLARDRMEEDRIRSVRYVVMSTEEEREIFARLQRERDPARAIAIRDEIIVRNLGLVRKEARKFTSDLMSAADLVQEGVFGLMCAINKFSLERGTKFSTYATSAIRVEMARAIVETGGERYARYPNQVSDAIRMLRRVKSHLRQRLEREPTHDEIVEFYVESAKRNEEQKAEKLAQKVIHLDRTWLTSLQAPLTRKDGDRRTISNSLADERAPNALDITEAKDSWNLIERAIEERFGNDRNVAIMRRIFGIGCPEEGEREIAENIGITRSRLNQVKHRCLRVAEKQGFSLAEIIRIAKILESQ